MRLARFIVLLVLAPASALTSPAPPDQHFQQAGRIRVHYFKEGPHAVDLTDINSNSIPDQVEDTLTQTSAAELLFVHILGFTDPFDSPKFREAEYLDIHFRNKEKLRRNGVAYDELQSYRRASDRPGTKSLCFNLATSVKPCTSLTPAHEYFHLIQYSRTRFKARWFTEGTARWSEYGLKEGVIGRIRKDVSWPLTAKEQSALFAMTYEASEHLWNGLASKSDPNGIIPDSLELKRLKALAYANGMKVLKDTRLAGWRFIRDLLEAMDDEDDRAFETLHYSDWTEANQTNIHNNSFILNAIGHTLERHGISQSK